MFDTFFSSKKNQKIIFNPRRTKSRNDRGQHKESTTETKEKIWLKKKENQI